MKLDRNVNADGRGKYALLKLRRAVLYEPAETFRVTPVLKAIELLEREEILDWGAGPDEEFFVIRLKDRFAAAALNAYADAASAADPEWADEVRSLAARAGPNSPFCKMPD